MTYVFILLLGVVASVKAALICPFPDYPLCGNDGRTYKNMCEWQLTLLFNPLLDLLHPGPCKKPTYELYKALLHGNGNLLRSRHRKNRKNKRLSSSSSDSFDSDEHDFIQRLATIPFSFRRDQEIQEEEQEE